MLLEVRAQSCLPLSPCSANLKKAVFVAGPGNIFAEGSGSAAGVSDSRAWAHGSLAVSPGMTGVISFSFPPSRSPWSNKYDPPLEDGAMPSARLRKLEVEANNAFDQYRDL